MLDKDLSLSAKHCFHISGGVLKSGQDYDLVTLRSKHIDHLLALQEIIYDDLPDEHKVFILPKSRQFFEDHFNRGNPMIGVIANDELIAQSIVLNPTKKYPKTGMVDMEEVGPPESVTVIQGMLVRPEFRGQKIAHVMADAWINISKKDGRFNALSETAIDNSKSWAVFLDMGMHMVSMGVDPEDGTKVYNIHNRVQRVASHFNTVTLGIAPQKVISMDDVSAITQAFEEGHIGHGWVKDVQPVLHFSKPENLVLNLR